jgi:hypothetical protein
VFATGVRRLLALRPPVPDCPQNSLDASPDKSVHATRPVTASREQRRVEHMSIEQTIAPLRRMTVTQLRDRYLEVFGEPSRSGNKDFLSKRVAWRVQSLAEGGLSERARRRAEELARDADIHAAFLRLGCAIICWRMLHLPFCYD